MTETPGNALQDIREWRGGLKMLIWLGGLGAPIAFGGLGFLHAQVNDGNRVNSVQQNQIDSLDKRADEDRIEQKRLMEKMDVKIDELLRRTP